jgi:NTP pyrophosphatase (non-canonical NTP hydrolase)
MEFNDYQIECKKTDLGNIGGRQELNPEWLYYVLGMAGEMGEFQEKIKKLFRDNDGKIDNHIRIELTYEMGDVLWYMARLCTKLGITMEEVAAFNIIKLSNRKMRNKLQGDGDNR